MCDTRDIARGLIKVRCPCRACRQAARHFGLDHHELTSVRQQFDVAASAGTESDMANHTVSARKAFASVADKARIGRSYSKLTPKGRLVIIESRNGSHETDETTISKSHVGAFPKKAHGDETRTRAGKKIDSQ